MSALPKPTLTEREYLEGERDSEVKYEYVDGNVYAQAGASRNHNVIVWNMSGLLFAQLHQRKCTAFIADLRVYIPAKRSYFYPDITVVCGEEHFTDLHNDTLLNPTIIIEVLSPSTETYDRTTKFERYRQISSLREYLLIAQNRVYVEHFVRQADDQWLVRFYIDRESVVELTSIQARLPLDVVYSKVEFEQAADESAQ